MEPSNLAIVGTSRRNLKVASAFVDQIGRVPGKRDAGCASHEDKDMAIYLEIITEPPAEPLLQVRPQERE